MEGKMKLRDLINILEEIEEELGDGDHEVLLMTQESWPFECTIEKIAIRKEFDDSDTEETHSNNGTSPTDIFLVEGKQLRYGSKKAWRE
jgi:hypothetical protein